MIGGDYPNSRAIAPSLKFVYGEGVQLYISPSLMPHRSSRRQARNVANYRQRGRTSGFQLPCPLGCRAPFRCQHWPLDCRTFRAYDYPSWRLAGQAGLAVHAFTPAAAEAARKQATLYEVMEKAAAP